MKKIETFEDLRNEQLMATDGEEIDMRNEVIDSLGEKVNEIVKWINKHEDLK